MLLNVSNLFNNWDHCLKTAEIFEHSYKYTLQPHLQDIFGLLSSPMLPLNDLMPNGDAQFDHLHYKIQNIDRLGSRVQLHCIQLVFSLLLSHFHYSWFQLGIILAEA